MSEEIEWYAGPIKHRTVHTAFIGEIPAMIIEDDAGYFALIGGRFVCEPSDPSAGRADDRLWWRTLESVKRDVTYLCRLLPFGVEDHLRMGHKPGQPRVVLKKLTPPASTKETT